MFHAMVPNHNNAAAYTSGLEQLLIATDQAHQKLNLASLA
jgi:hypothetical protein